MWQKLGRENNDPQLTAWETGLSANQRIWTATFIPRCNVRFLKVNGETIIPSIAGVQEPFHVAVAGDALDPQYRSYRAYMEMLYSGILDKEEVSTIVRYRASHYDTILGIPVAYGYRTSELAGFLSYGHAYGLIQHDMVREAILMLYSLMANQYTRGTWTAPETRNIIPDKLVAPYCSPAQLVVPLITRWLLAFEDPQSETLWLGKGLPRDWLEDGKTTSISGAPTRWGKVGFTVVSHLQSDSIAVTLALPARFAATTVVQLRAPVGRTMKSVTVNSKPWKEFDPKDETITIPAGYSGAVDVAVSYSVEHPTMFDKANVGQGGQPIQY